ELYRVKTRLVLPETPKPPLLVAALGPDMLRLCGRLADGTVISMGGLAYIRDFAVPIMSAAAAKAGRPRPRIVAGLPVTLTRDVRTVLSGRQSQCRPSACPDHRQSLPGNHRTASPCHGRPMLIRVDGLTRDQHERPGPPALDLNAQQPGDGGDSVAWINWLEI